MSVKKIDKQFHSLHGTAAIMAEWGLRIMLFLGGCRNVGKGGKIVDLEEYEWKGLGLRSFENGLDTRKFREIASRRLHSLARDEHIHDEPFRSNMNLLVKNLGLSETEKQILEFALMVCNDGFLNSICSYIAAEKEAYAKLDKVLATILDCKASETGAALSMQGKLLVSGLLQVDKSPHRDLSGRLEVLDGLVRSVFEVHEDVFSLLRPFCPSCREPSIHLEDFPHLSREIDWMLRYLRKGLGKRRKGVNILLYGPPGTGKTELALNLGRACRARCYEVAMSDSMGDSLTGESRFSAFRLAQNVLSSRTKNIIIFDEIEDVFGGAEGDFFRILMKGSGSAGTKSWINQMLENNPIPTIWITNSQWNMDHAYLRRFDLVIEIKVPPRHVRKKILERNITRKIRKNLNEHWLDTISEYSHINPAMIARAAKIVSEYGFSESGGAEQHMEAMLNNWCNAMGLPKVHGARDAGEMTYRMDLLNTTPPLGRLVSGLEKSGSGRLCLYGPPGTGKTAFGRHVARRLDSPLLVKRASDILSMWVGGTEKRIARMFNEAEQDGAILLLDEADSFLQDRRNSSVSWEITQVNELLTQMEHFRGLFICSTNLIDTLDEASLRRFDLKVRFHSLQADQRWEMFRQVLKDATGSARDADNEWEQRVKNKLDGVTFGDFMVALRQFRLMGDSMTEEKLFLALQDEIRLKKQGAGSGIGFSAVI